MNVSSGTPMRSAIWRNTAADREDMPGKLAPLQGRGGSRPMARGPREGSLRLSTSLSITVRYCMDITTRVHESFAEESKTQRGGEKGPGPGAQVPLRRKSSATRVGNTLCAACSCRIILATVFDSSGNSPDPHRKLQSAVQMGAL